MAKKKHSPESLSLADTQRAQRLEKLTLQVDRFVEEHLDDGDFSELKVAMDRYLAMYEKCRRRQNLEATLFAVLGLLWVILATIEPNFRSPVVMVPATIFLIRLLYQMEQLGTSQKYAIIGGPISEEREAIIQALERLNLYVAGGSATHFQFLQSDLSEHDLIAMVYEISQEKDQTREQGLLARAQNGYSVITEDGELNFSETDNVLKLLSEK